MFVYTKSILKKPFTALKIFFKKNVALTRTTGRDFDVDKGIGRCFWETGKLNCDA